MAMKQLRTFKRGLDALSPAVLNELGSLIDVMPGEEGRSVPGLLAQGRFVPELLALACDRLMLRWEADRQQGAHVMTGLHAFADNPRAVTDILLANRPAPHAGLVIFVRQTRK